MEGSASLALSLDQEKVDHATDHRQNQYRSHHVEPPCPNVSPPRCHGASLPDRVVYQNSNNLELRGLVLSDTKAAESQVSGGDPILVHDGVKLPRATRPPPRRVH